MTSQSGANKSQRFSTRGSWPNQKYNRHRTAIFDHFVSYCWNENIRGQHSIGPDIVLSLGSYTALKMWILYSLTAAAVAIKCVYSQDFICPTAEGFYPHPVDCDKYYQCANTRGTMFQCQEGTYWSETNLVCSWRHDVSGCDDNGKRIHSAVNNQDKTSHRDVKATGSQLKEDIGKTTDVGNLRMKAGATYHGARVQQTTLPFTSPDETATATTFRATSQNDVPASTTLAYAAESFWTDFRCPTRHGLFRDPYNCRTYYHCVHWAPYKRQCPSEQYYDLDSSSCAPKSEVGDCLFFGEPGEEGEFMIPVTPGSVPFDCPKDYGYYPDLNDCSYYFECILGNPYRRQCMHGTLFDRVRHKCTWESLVRDCASLTTSSKNVTPKDPNTKAFKCPTDDGYFRNPGTCRSYFHCIDGNPIYLECDSGSVFDPYIGKCTWSGMVSDCDLEGNPIDPSASNQQSDLKEKKENAQQSLSKIPGSIFEFACPLPNGHFRDDDNCAIFYHCLSDVPYKGYCRNGHAFDTDMLMCVSASRIPGCEGQQEETKSLDSAEIPILESVDTENKVLNEGIISYRSFKCPKEDGYFRDPDNCAVYFFCTKWKVYQHQCKPGTVFSMEKFTCTWPRLVPGCDTNTTQTAQAVEEGSERNQDTGRSDIQPIEPVAPTNQPGEVITQHGEKLPEMNSITEAASISFVCPPVFDGFYGDPISCSRFYRCIGGKMYTFSCPQGTYFDNLRFLCNFVSEVTDCTPQGIRNTMISQNDEFGESSYDLPPPGFNDVGLPCPKSDGVFAHPTSCKQFVYCTKFVPQVFECPRDLVYNIQIHSCDYPDSAICKLYD